jgi:hypothetical protein
MRQRRLAPVTVETYPPRLAENSPLTDMFPRSQAEAAGRSGGGRRAAAGDGSGQQRATGRGSSGRRVGAPAGDGGRRGVAAGDGGLRGGSSGRRRAAGGGSGRRRVGVASVDRCPAAYSRGADEYFIGPFRNCLTLHLSQYAQERNIFGCMCDLLNGLHAGNAR